jgi:hypothetical protein
MSRRPRHINQNALHGELLASRSDGRRSRACLANRVRKCLAWCMIRVNNSSKRDLKWFEVLERVRETNRNIELTAPRSPDTGRILRAGYAAKIYVAAFQNFLDVDFGTFEDNLKARWWWTAHDVFDAVNVVLCQEEYDGRALEWEQRDREHGGSPPDDGPPGGTPPNNGLPSDRKDPPSGVVQLRPRGLKSAKPSTSSESALPASPASGRARPGRRSAG